MLFWPNMLRVDRQKRQSRIRICSGHNYPRVEPGQTISAGSAHHCRILPATG